MTIVIFFSSVWRNPYPWNNLKTDHFSRENREVHIFIFTVPLATRTWKVCHRITHQSLNLYFILQRFRDSGEFILAPETVTRGAEMQCLQVAWPQGQEEYPMSNNFSVLSRITELYQSVSTQLLKWFGSMFPPKSHLELE